VRRKILGGSRCSVLIVEDEFVLAEDLLEEAEARGFAVVGPAPTLSAAFALLDTAGLRTDAAILDVSLPDGQSFPLAERLMRDGIPFVFMTGYPASSLPAAFGHIPVFAKPFLAGAILDEVAALASQGTGST